ncbi:MAG: M23 family metallopeptidase [Candidatus Kerfeldbacteria bacterium]|nr:M23 family metallopeptidase [Candidatus Kerfeldbacteria bacterium]
MTKLLLHIIKPFYRYFMLVGHQFVASSRWLVQQYAIQVLVGVLITVQFTQVLYAQAFNPTISPSQAGTTQAHSYISFTGYVVQQIPDLQLGSTIWPSRTHRLSRGFSAGHAGLDIDGEFGDPIYAMTAGSVASITNTGPYGNKIVLQHAGGITTLYAHLQKINVQSGQTVTAKQLLGEMGSTGRSTGSHLHFEVRRHGQLIDPASIF